MLGVQSVTNEPMPTLEAWALGALEACYAGSTPIQWNAQVEVLSTNGFYAHDLLHSTSTIFLGKYGCFHRTVGQGSPSTPRLKQQVHGDKICE